MSNTVLSPAPIFWLNWSDGDQSPLDRGLQVLIILAIGLVTYGLSLATYRRESVPADLEYRTLTCSEYISILLRTSLGPNLQVFGYYPCGMASTTYQLQHVLTGPRFTLMCFLGVNSSELLMPCTQDMVCP
jgi:hypothetical protein